ncbi:MAG: hypothetical protein E6K71_05790 [Candidatus Eisenbacteria bacterium]|uniref:Uncharacterized protein n=1 Tax=Eiseniibacteriota bacterium TaxID=2212470 RepID=A0A538SCM1_UNCEI|nr:MAG: hypothetical protein E6K71_05790 [Candidatus Eisenbacteria bacterium]
MYTCPHPGTTAERTITKKGRERRGRESGRAGFAFAMGAGAGAAAGVGVGAGADVRAGCGGTGAWARAAAPLRRSAARTSARAALLPRERVRDGEKEKEDPTETIDSDHDSVREIMPQGRIPQQILEPFPERDHQHDENHEGPLPGQRDDDDRSQEPDYPRIAPIERDQRMQEPVHAPLPLLPGLGGGNVWESNPPRTV